MDRTNRRSRRRRHQPDQDWPCRGSYHRRPRRAEDAALLKLLKGLSCRDYEACVELAAETFGLTASSLSRRFKRASAKKLAEMSERDLSGYDLVLRHA